MRWSRNVMFLCQHSLVPAKRRTAMSEGRFGSMDSSSARAVESDGLSPRGCEDCELGLVAGNIVKKMAY
ncbi:hypothetical protein TorRG33x02_164410 [Trema orientale]|uniref:Uncharacterized protein n=1 Tax=Trema orientale TaxID=63057 RepID=A0A2P5EQF2_TREOI|nr:hypothetical protein TorRG33x02_164410 [Trema orientale]